MEYKKEITESGKNAEEVVTSFLESINAEEIVIR